MLPPNAGKGRPKGTPNKTTALLRDAILKGAENAGGGDLEVYLTKQAEDHPAQYLALLGRILPMQVKGEVEHKANDPIAELLQTIAENGRKITDR